MKNPAMQHLPRPLAVAAAVAAATALLLSGCASGNSTKPTAPGAGDEIGHVHGLGIDPADGTLYAAGHYGVFRINEDGVPTRIADRWQDTMAFTVTGPNTFLGSGHPDPREDQPPHLGLIESTDAAKTWKPVALHGEADFHALEVVGDRIFGYNSVEGQILTTTDRTTWETLTSGQFIDLAPSPGKDDRILATTGKGELVEITLDGRTTTVIGAPILVRIDTTPSGVAAGVGPSGEIYTRTETTGVVEWKKSGMVPGQPAAFDATDDVWHVATDNGIFSSVDRGVTWKQVLEFSH